MGILAEQLVSRINTYLRSKNIQGEITNEYIQIITLEGDIAISAVKCIFCSSEINCKFDRIWNTSWNICNYTAHIRKHPQHLLPAETHQATRQAIETPGPSSSPLSEQIMRGNTSVLAEVESILR